MPRPRPHPLRYFGADESEPAEKWQAKLRRLEPTMRRLNREAKAALEDLARRQRDHADHVEAAWFGAGAQRGRGDVAGLLDRIIAERRVAGATDAELEPPDETPTKLPSGWRYVRLAQLAAIRAGFTARKLRSADGAFPIVQVGDLVQGGVVTEARAFAEAKHFTKKAALVIFPRGTLVVGIGGGGATKGMCSTLGIAACLAQSVAAIIPAPSAERYRDYLRAWLVDHYDAIRATGRGKSAYPPLRIAALRDLVIPLPPVGLAGAVLREVERRRAQRDDLLRLALRELEGIERERVKALRA